MLLLPLLLFLHIPILLLGENFLPNISIVALSEGGGAVPFVWGILTLRLLPALSALRGRPKGRTRRRHR